MRRKLYLVRGLPGSGKSTLAKAVSVSETAYHVEADQFWGEEYKFTPKLIRQAHEWCLAEATRQLHLTGCVVVSNTFTTAKELLPYIQMAEHMEAIVSIFVCRGEFGSVHDVPERIIEAMKARWEEEVCFDYVNVSVDPPARV